MTDIDVSKAEPTTTDSVADEITNNEPTTTNNSEEKLTKTQLKKKRKLENIMKTRVEKRKKEREAKKQKRLANKQNADENEAKVTRNSLKKNLMANSTNKLRVVIDCSFENLMSDNDISHLCKQLQFCYAANRRLKSPLQFHVTDYNSKLKAMLDKQGGSNWVNKVFF